MQVAMGYTGVESQILLLSQAKDRWSIIQANIFTDKIFVEFDYLHLISVGKHVKVYIFGKLRRNVIRSHKNYLDILGWWGVILG